MQPIAARDFHDLVFVEDPVVDPAGQQVAFVRTTAHDEEEYEGTIYVRDLEGDTARRMTVAEGRDSQPRWRPDGAALAFVSDRLGGDERPQLWLLPVDGGEAEQLTSVAGGVSTVSWSPDGSRLAFTQHVDPDDIEADRDLEVAPDYEPEEPDPRVVDRTVYRAEQRYADRGREQVYVVDPERGDVERVSEWDGTDHRFPSWGDDGVLYYGHRVGEDPDDSLEHELVAVDLERGESRAITVLEGFVGGLDADGDGHLVVGLAPAPRPTLRSADAVLVDAESGETTVLTADLDRTVTGPIRFAPTGEAVYYLTPDEGGVVVRRTRLDGTTHDVLTDPAGHASAFDVDGSTLAFSMSEWDHPGDLFVRDLDGGDTRRLTAVNADLLDDRAIARPEERWFDGPGDHEIQGWLLRPPEATEEKSPYPLVLEVHGGPHAMWSTSGTMWHEFQTLAGAGYAVLWTNPRGSSGYGEAYMRAIAEDWGDATHADLMAALDETVERTAIDADQLFLTGGSFGGYQTAWTVGSTDRFEAAVAQRGVYDIPAFFGTTDAYQLIESEFDATPWSDQAGLYDRSPTSRLAAVDTPTLLIHSEQDYRTPIATAEMYYRGLRKLGVPTRLVRYPREGHELSRSGEPGHRVDRIERIVRWFDGYADHADVPPALDREPDAGLSAGEAASDGDTRE
ncbi:MAG: S9 family peptidase [Halobacteriales archaeon]